MSSATAALSSNLHRLCLASTRPVHQGQPQLAVFCVCSCDKSAPALSICAGFGGRKQQQACNQHNSNSSSRRFHPRHRLCRTRVVQEGAGAGQHLHRHSHLAMGTGARQQQRRPSSSSSKLVGGPAANQQHTSNKQHRQCHRRRHLQTMMGHLRRHHHRHQLLQALAQQLEG